MRLIYTLLALILTINISIGQDQSRKYLKGVATRNLSSKIKAEDEIELIGFKESDNSGYIYLRKNDNVEKFTPIVLKSIDFIANTPHDFWYAQAIYHGVYHNIGKNGFQYDKRKSMEEEVLEFRNKVIRHSILNDDYLQSYLYSLICEIYPVRLNDGRPGVISVTILKDSEPNAFIGANGAMFINTGLISLLNSEEELKAVLCHEIAHFVLDHHIININKQEQREARAVFWGSVMTGVAAATEIYAASEYDYYANGALTQSVGYASMAIAASVTNRLGLKYSRKQELIADECALAYFEFAGINQYALTSALQKIKDYCIKNGQYSVLSDEGTHPSIDARINATIHDSEQYEESNYKEVTYDQVFSEINSINAIIEYQNQRLLSAKHLLMRNIEANVATERDFHLLSIITLSLYNDKEHNLEALNLIQNAKTLNVYPIVELHKQEGIAYMRLHNMVKAKECFKRYSAELSEMLESERFGLSLDYLEDQVGWAKMMAMKAGKM